MGRFFSFLISLFLFPSFLFSSTFLLNVKDVRKVMDELLTYHVEEKEMSPKLLSRSLKIYVDDFDPAKIYFVEEEVSSYLRPSSSLLNKMMREYNEDHFTTYFTINQEIEKSVKRARSWRQEWERDPIQLVKAAEGLKKSDMKYEVYPAHVATLKERHKEMFLRLIRAEKKSLSATYEEGKEASLITLCEKKLVQLENGFLGVNDRGEESGQELEHIVILHTIKALAHSLDAHTAYFSPDEAFSMKVLLEKGMCGIGVILREGLEGVMVAELVKGGPAEKSGKLKVGDAIVSVDKTPIRELSFQKVLEILRGDEGSKVELGILRKDAGQEKTLLVDLYREKMVIDDKRVDISSEPFGDGVIGKITLYAFYEGEDGISSEKDLRKAIEKLREEGPLHGLVFDMRDNSGGFLSQAVRVSSLFISSGVVVVSKYADGTMKYYRALDGRRFFDGPLVVLVSKESASAAEIVAAALQDYGVAVVVGDEHTYGKGTIQHQTLTGDNNAASLFKVTVGRYYTVSGKTTQISGVKSDIVVPTELSFEEVGEGYLEFPLKADSIEPSYNDKLSDIDPYARKWFSKYYLPTVQKKEIKWESLLPVLKENSEKRLSTSKNFSNFLEAAKEKCSRADKNFGCDDLQMKEAVDIVKDMIFLEKAQTLTHQ